MFDKLSIREEKSIVNTFLEGEIVNCYTFNKLVLVHMRRISS